MEYRCRYFITQQVGRAVTYVMFRALVNRLNITLHLKDLQGPKGKLFNALTGWD